MNQDIKTDETTRDGREILEVRNASSILHVDRLRRGSLVHSGAHGRGLAIGNLVAVGGRSGHGLVNHGRIVMMVVVVTMVNAGRVSMRKGKIERTCSAPPCWGSGTGQL